MAPRRFSTYLLLAGFSLLLIFLYSISEPSVASIGADAPQKPTTPSSKLPSFKAPSLYFSFRKSSHKPAQQPHSTKGDSAWFSSWKWLNPFSSSITLDENRSVLPPLPTRPPVYTYYDFQTGKDDKRAEADQALLLTWRRAWWANGFRPVVLGQAEARKNPLYQRKQASLLPPKVNDELNRWLAWGYMDTGLLTTLYCVPMGSRDDSLLSFLRRGQYPSLNRFQGLGTGLYVAGKTRVNDAVREVLSSPKLRAAQTFGELFLPVLYENESAQAIAHYDAAAITKHYPAVAEKLRDTPNDGRLALNTLINSHLHSTWQNVFHQGIAVLKPLPAHTTALVASSLRLASLLTECPESFMPSSCPPNRPTCTPCVSTRMLVTLPDTLRNISSLYFIGTVPHPYTMLSLANMSDEITVPQIRRHTDRDPWLKAITQSILGTGAGGPSRVVGFKESIASDHVRGHSLWLTTEHLPASIPTVEANTLPETWLSDLDWHFGFLVPRAAIAHGESVPPVPGPERWPKSKPGLPVEKKKSWEPNLPSDERFATEVDLLARTRGTISSKEPQVGRIVKVVEAWNLADVEAWRFARAYRDRSLLERATWDEEEQERGGQGRRDGRWWRT